MTHTQSALTALLICGLGLLPAAPASGRSLEEAVRHFDEGNIRYDQGDFPGALGSYERALDAGFISGALYFNMGNAYYRLDELGQAMRYYQKAAELMPQSAELDHNLAIVREASVDQFSRLPDPFWRVAWRGYVRVFGMTGLFVVGFVFYLAAMGVTALRIRQGQTAWRRRIFAASVALALIFLSAGFAASVESAKPGRAVVLLDEVTLLDAPDGGRSDLEIHEGLVVDIVRERDGWMEVRLPNGATGWIRDDTVGRI